MSHVIPAKEQNDPLEILIEEVLRDEITTDDNDNENEGHDNFHEISFRDRPKPHVGPGLSDYFLRNRSLLPMNQRRSFMRCR